MVQAEKKTRFVAGPVTYIVRYDLWGENIQDHADQGVSIVVHANVEGKDTALLRFDRFDIEKAIFMARRIPLWKSRGLVCLRAGLRSPKASKNYTGWTQ